MRYTRQKQRKKLSSKVSLRLSINVAFGRVNVAKWKFFCVPIWMFYFVAIIHTQRNIGILCARARARHSLFIFRPYNTKFHLNNFFSKRFINVAFGGIFIIFAVYIYIYGFSCRSFPTHSGTTKNLWYFLLLSFGWASHEVKFMCLPWHCSASRCVRLALPAFCKMSSLAKAHTTR